MRPPPATAASRSSQTSAAAASGKSGKPTAQAASAAKPSKKTEPAKQAKPPARPAEQKPAPPRAEPARPKPARAVQPASAPKPAEAAPPTAPPTAKVAPAAPEGETKARPMPLQASQPRAPSASRGEHAQPSTVEPGPRHNGPPPRPPAKAEIFVEGDHVVYPTHGVGKVERIAVEEIAGHKLELIHITFEENRMTLRVPVTKARSAGLRKLATRKMFDEALGVLKGRARIKRTMWSRRAQEYEAKINSGDPLAIAEVVRDLHRNAGQPDQSFSERQIYEAAMDRLAAELAALDKTDKPTAATKLTEFLKTV